MSQSNESTFAYVSFIRAAPEKVWSALTDSNQMKEYWFGMHFQTEWTVGAKWQMLFPDGRIADTGEILELDPPRRMRLKWRNEFKPELRAEGFALCTIEVEPYGESVRLSIMHTMERADSQFIKAVSGGWPKVLSNLKSLLETGRVVLTETDRSHA
jgi:uncharacterized protein YndB with AHSA1/START domain